MDEYYLQQAEKNMPEMFYHTITSNQTVEIIPDENAFFGCKAEKTGTVPPVLSTGDTFVLDFGCHCVGQLSLRLDDCVQHMDAPVRLKLKFAEIPYEIQRDCKTYHGGLSPSWLQEEIINIDIKGIFSLPRRYTFRFLQITVLAAPKPIKLSDFTVKCITSADISRKKPLPPGTDPMLVAIDDVAAATLRDCMQTAYEDGPKRDQRLWIGDFRLQALTDYTLFSNSTLMKRCMYLFAACEEPNHYLPGCLFQLPEVEYDQNTGITDYAMLYCVSLCDYYDNTKDLETTKDLFPVAMRQINLAVRSLDENGILTLLGGWNSFIDWAKGIRCRTAVHGVFLYAIDRMIALAAALGRSDLVLQWQRAKITATEGAQNHLYDSEKQAFVNQYDGNQYSVQSQVWMILGNVVDQETGRVILTKALQDECSLKPVTPYMHHYLLEAFLKLGMKDEALTHIKEYWGKMIALGADTFWEVFVDNHPEISPYEDPMIHSFCHAWSCSPSYFIRKYFI